MKAYAAQSPTFNAFELAVEQQTDGFFAPNGDSPNFCNGCHSPLGVENDELPDYVNPQDARPMAESLSVVGHEGITCDSCHSVHGPDLGGSLLGDGIANVSLLLGITPAPFGPFGRAVDSAYHETGIESRFLRSGEFCGGCHDVRPTIPDPLTGQPFQRLENLFTEWQASPYGSPADPDQRVTCQDCHMSMYPFEPPGTYPVGRAAVTTGLGTDGSLQDRRVSPHYFTGVSTSLYPDILFHQDDPELDEFGLPKGLSQRREAMLRAACTLSFGTTPSQVDGSVLPLQVVVTNVGAGHNVPAGFSQERQVWLEVIVLDQAGRTIYQSGYLVDQPHPETGEMVADGNLADEDLQHEVFSLDPETFEVIEEHHGPDADLRPEQNLGLVNFQNKFLIVDERGETHEVHSAHLAQSMDNSHSLLPLQPTPFAYDIPIPEDAVGPLDVRVRLRYRTFPPVFLRVLAQRTPELVTEEVIDRNRIIDMAEIRTQIDSSPGQD